MLPDAPQRPWPTNPRIYLTFGFIWVGIAVASILVGFYAESPRLAVIVAGNILGLLGGYLWSRRRTT